MDQINTNNIYCRTPLFYATTWITKPFRMEVSLLDQQSSYFHLKWHMLSIIPFENSLVLYVFHGRQHHTSGGTDHKWSSDDVRMICFKRIYYLWPVHCWLVVLAGTLTIALSLCLWQCFWSIIVQWLKMKCKICCQFCKRRRNQESQGNKLRNWWKSPPQIGRFSANYLQTWK